MVRSALSLAAAASLCIVLAACGSTAASVGPSASLEPSIAPSAPPTASPAPEPTPTPEPSEPPVDSVPIPSDAYARVVTDDLRVRSKPGVSGDSTKLEPLLQRDTLVLVVDGPVQASGYDWYQVQPLARSDLDEPVAPFGWVAAAGKDGEPWIEPDAVECPPVPTDLDGLANLSEISENYYGITCFSGDEISFTARLVTPDSWCGLGAETNWDPVWMGTCSAPPNYLVRLDDDDGGSAFWPAWSPDVDLGIAPPMESPPDMWPQVRVTGMFDHPAAQSCRSRPDSKVDPEVILNCRRLFVVTSMHLVDR